MAIQNIARGMLTPNTDRFPDRFHRIAVNEMTDAIELMAPNSSVEPLVLLGVFGSGPTLVVKMSISA